ncbi:ATP-grasp domain-containing protein [Streptomyces sp. H34-S4]|uniref:ATP-grasp domain-containing protein n=1 Tax=Streptomyces sp. H34-S4 TaxID=2996463 RepID=UPI0022709387|nr:ATP-grasp domain-containing protein [Streptomyces sp. H34-S4]MCY0935587.1 ATP-grasp domain-containing protein [Streptomyces sp. H34-S4]
MTASRPVLVLLYQRVGLPWLFESAARAGIDLVLVPRPDEEVDPDRMPPAVVELLALDPVADPAHALETLRKQHAATPFDGIVTLYDPLVPFAAQVAELLGLPGIGLDVARGTQDKRVTRERLAAAGLNVPLFVRLDPADDPVQSVASAGLAYPVVVKPALGMSSLGVTRADSPATIGAIVAEVRRVSAGIADGGAGLLVEEYLDGPEFAVESLVHEGRVQILAIGFKGDPQGPYFEESVYRAPAELPEAVRAEVVREVTAAHAALGVAVGPTHTELRLRGGCDPYLLEMGARIGGSGVSHYIAEAVTGIDFAGQALRLAAGLPPARAVEAGLAEPVAAAANYIVPCGGHGTITAVHGIDALRADARVDHVVQMLVPGDLVRPYPDFTGYPAFVLSRHADLSEAEGFHAHLEAAVRIDYAPGPGPQDAS